MTNELRPAHLGDDGLVLPPSQAAGVEGVRDGSGVLHGSQAASAVPSTGSGSASADRGHDGPGGEITRGSQSITFVVPGRPVGKGRPRIGKAGGFSRLYTPEKTVSYESLVGWTAAQVMAGRPPFLGPVAVSLHIDLEIPASWSKVKRATALEGRVYATTKPDADNVIKAIFDGLNGVVWKDDVQVTTLFTIKRYAAVSGVTVQVREIFHG